MTDVTTEAAGKSSLTPEDHEQLTKLLEQLWFCYVTTRNPTLLSTHQELTDLRDRIAGQDE